ncbi:MAG: alginate O-acetyltransferase complex protein AlgI [Arcticibacterium sp.]|jgi:alginate O-acetyltransferase complex protein AlgI
MLFNSLDFAFFLPIVFTIYWLIPKTKIRSQNLLLLFASYVFYGWWDWRFLSLIIFSTLVDFLVGLEIQRSTSSKRKKLMLWISIVVNLGFLGFFKYFDFFIENFQEAFTFLGYNFGATSSLNIILPVGISFYTFQTLSYSIDVYKGKLNPTKDLIQFSAYVSFFPQLVAGPIERAVNLLPQFSKSRSFDVAQAVDGMRQILWGLFKKIVIADNCAIIVNQIFTDYTEFNGSTLLIGAVLFAFQIYGDFSGYSDIAIGVAKLFGFRLMKNFAFPYFSRDIAEFWRRWHISLSTWFRDYVYIPLGGSFGSSYKKVRNVMIIFLVSGFWHGANWTFIVWGLLNAIYFLPLLLLRKNRKNIGPVTQDRLFPSFNEFCQILLTFALTVVAWVFFRSPTVTVAMDYLLGMFNLSLFNLPDILPKKLMLYVFVMLLTEWFHRDREFGLDFRSGFLVQWARWSIYLFIVFLILFETRFHDQAEFIYFQF